MLTLPIETPRLRIRMMEQADLARLVAYRNDPDVARYQDWPLPYTDDDARSALAAQADLDGPVPGGDMVQLALEHEGAVVGDLGVDLRFRGETAAVGYTLAQEAQGRGLALEAVDAVVDALFAGGVRRVIASTDPANASSIRVLDLLGFRCEGLARRAEPIRGDWLDDLRFGLLADERAAWVARPRSHARVELHELRAETAREVAGLDVLQHQRAFVAPVGVSLAEAMAPPVEHGHTVRPWVRVIVADGEVAGFVMVALPIPSQPEPFLWRLLIDGMHQGRGVGAAAVRALADHFRADGHAGLMVSWREGVGGPRRFYERLGFAEVGVEDGETVARLPIG